MPFFYYSWLSLPFLLLCVLLLAMVILTAVMQLSYPVFCCFSIFYGYIFVTFADLPFIELLFIEVMRMTEYINTFSTGARHMILHLSSLIYVCVVQF